jgi:hypothetical protein
MPTQKALPVDWLERRTKNQRVVSVLETTTLSQIHSIRLSSALRAFASVQAIHEDLSGVRELGCQERCQEYSSVRKRT